MSKKESLAYKRYLEDGLNFADSKLDELMSVYVFGYIVDVDAVEIWTAERRYIQLEMNMLQDRLSKSPLMRFTSWVGKMYALIDRKGSTQHEASNL